MDCLHQRLRHDAERWADRVVELEVGLRWRKAAP